MCKLKWVKGQDGVGLLLYIKEEYVYISTNIIMILKKT